MTRFWDNMAARALGLAGVVDPRLDPRFAVQVEGRGLEVEGQALSGLEGWKVGKLEGQPMVNGQVHSVEGPGSTIESQVLVPVSPASRSDAQPMDVVQNPNTAGQATAEMPTRAEVHSIERRVVHDQIEAAEQSDVRPVEHVVQRPAEQLSNPPTLQPSNRLQPSNLPTFQPSNLAAFESRPTTPPEIHISIGRVEVRAVQPGSQHRPPATHRPSRSLDDYLRERDGERR